MKKYQRCVLCPEIELTWFVHIYKTLHPITILVTIEAPKIPSMHKATSKLVSSRREHGDRGGRAIVARRISFSQTRPGGCFCVQFRHCTLHQAVVRIGTYSEDWRPKPSEDTGFPLNVSIWPIFPVCDMGHPPLLELGSELDASDLKTCREESERRQATSTWSIFNIKLMDSKSKLLIDSWYT